MAEQQPYEAIGGDAAGMVLETTLRTDYATAKANFVGFGAWMYRLCYTASEKGVAGAIAQHQPDWRAELARAKGEAIAWPAPDVRPFHNRPLGRTLLGGRLTAQGLMVTTEQFGLMPWWPACWAWLTPADRAAAARQLLAAGDEICLMQVPDGVPLYDEPRQFYSPDKFGAIPWNVSVVVALVEEAIDLGFAGVWVFLGGDDGGKGFPIACAQSRELGPAFARSSRANLNEYVVQVPGWDGVWHKPNPSSGTGYTREQLAAFAEVARAAGALYLGCEHGTGYAIAGKGTMDFQPGGVMRGYDLILGEFDDDLFDGSVWQILARFLPPGTYRRPADQPTAGPEADAGAHPYYLADSGAVYRVFEFYMYGGVRGADPAHIRTVRARFEAMGARAVC